VNPYAPYGMMVPQAMPQAVAPSGAYAASLAAAQQRRAVAEQPAPSATPAQQQQR
jgi:hypothetical protein